MHTWSIENNESFVYWESNSQCLAPSVLVIAGNIADSLKSFANFKRHASNLLMHKLSQFLHMLPKVLRCNPTIWKISFFVHFKKWEQKSRHYNCVQKFLSYKWRSKKENVPLWHDISMKKFTIWYHLHLTLHDILFSWCWLHVKYSMISTTQDDCSTIQCNSGCMEKLNLVERKSFCSIDRTHINSSFIQLNFIYCKQCLYVGGWLEALFKFVCDFCVPLFKVSNYECSVQMASKSIWIGFLESRKNIIVHDALQTVVANGIRIHYYCLAGWDHTIMGERLIDWLYFTFQMLTTLQSMQSSDS